MNIGPIEMTTEECLERLHAGEVGRVALATPTGPRIVPVNYAMDGDTIVFVTTPYSELGTYGNNSVLAFEIDSLSDGTGGGASKGWSVVAIGRSELVRDTAAVRTLREDWDHNPWVGGRRPMYLRLRWRELTGRRITGQASERVR